MIFLFETKKKMFSRIERNYNTKRNTESRETGCVFGSFVVSFTWPRCDQSTVGETPVDDLNLGSLDLVFL